MSKYSGKKNPRAHKNKIGTPPPPPKPPFKTRNFMDMGFPAERTHFFQASIKLAQPFPAPELRTRILRTRGFFWTQARKRHININFFVRLVLERRRRWPWPRFAQESLLAHMVMVLWTFVSEKEKTMTMTKISSKRTCYTYGHGPLTNLLQVGLGTTPGLSRGFHRVCPWDKIRWKPGTHPGFLLVLRSGSPANPWDKPGAEGRHREFMWKKFMCLFAR